MCWLYFWGLFLEQRRSSVVMFGCLVNLYKKYTWPGQNFEQGVKLCKDSQRITHMFTNKVL